MRGHLKYINQRLSLRKPQAEALYSLSQFLRLTELPVRKDLDWMQLQQQFPGLMEFEHSFPSVCFDLPTGIGKTRLMGAMITYLMLEKRIRNFLVFAPNNTILDKLIADFGDPNNTKYVFQGIAEFANRRPLIITADNWDLGHGVRNEHAKQKDLFAGVDDIHLNIFNIAKMHSDNRKIKKDHDRHDIPYFDYLSGLEDLVVLMDEAHQYRACKAMQTVQALSPLLGLEFTATPETGEIGRSTRFKNILYEYPLSAAIQDGYLKEPAVAGRENFNSNNFRSDQELEQYKISDGIQLHERTKLHLQAYAEESGERVVKPLMLIVTQDTKHADEIERLIESEDFFSGAYKGKVLTVHSGRKAEQEEAMVRSLLTVECPNNPIEIVIHVNMLREGWDVVNLYTMVPLRKANSKNLIIQNLGRGLRLPYGKRTGKIELDTHTVVSHDRFNDIIDAANKDDSIIKRGIRIGKDVSSEPLEVVEVIPRERQEMTNIEDHAERTIAFRTFDAIHSCGLQTREEVLAYVSRGTNTQDQITQEEFVDKYLKICRDKAIHVPQIIVEPRVVNNGGFTRFKLDLQHVSIKPFEEGIVVQSLSSGVRTVYDNSAAGNSHLDPHQQLSMYLHDYNDVAEFEENSEVVNDCVDQMLQHLETYIPDHNQIAQLVQQQGSHLASIIHGQMLDHFEEPKLVWDETISDKIIPLPKKRIPLPKNAQPRDFSKPVDNKLSIREMVFTGFQKSTYPMVKFDSDSERVLSVILEQDPVVKKWVKPPRGAFKFIHYTKDYNYEPDFFVETVDAKYLIEVKRKSQLDDTDVISKARAAAHWCALASDHAIKYQDKPWTYLLIPHDELNLAMTLTGLAAYHTYR